MLPDRRARLIVPGPPLNRAWLGNDEDEDEDEDEDRPLLDDRPPRSGDPLAEASCEAAIEVISRKVGGLSALSEGWPS